MVKQKKKVGLSKGDYTQGPRLAPLLSIGFSLLIGGLLNKTYLFADKLIIGRISGDPYAIGAIGSAGSPVSLLTGVIFGLAIGNNVIVARRFGAKDYRGVSETLHTSVIFSSLAGLVAAIIGTIFCTPLLNLIGTKAEFIAGARSYLLVYFWGIPFSAIYNYGAGVLRGTGNPRIPTFILFISGLINVVLNVVFVAAFGMGTAGVAIATVISQAYSAIHILFSLSRCDERFAFRFSRLRLNPQLLKAILVLGIPICIQNSIGSITSLITSSARNTLEAEAITAFSVSSTIVSFTNAVSCSFTVSAIIAFVGQNWGARNFDRVKKCMLISEAITTFLAILMSRPQIIFSEFLIKMFIDAETVGANLVIEYTKDIMIISLVCELLHGFSNMLGSFARATGHTMTPMVSSLLTSTVVHLIWCLVFFPMPRLHTPVGYSIIGPFSAILTIILMSVFAAMIFKREKRKTEQNS